MSLVKPSFNHTVSGSDCEEEDYLVNADDHKPRSPLSVQHDGGLVPVQSPPFENESAEKPSSTLSDYSNQVELDADNGSVASSDIDHVQHCATATGESDRHQGSEDTSELHQVSESGPGDQPSTKRQVSVNLSELQSTEEKESNNSVKISSPIRTLPVKKSVQRELLQFAQYCNATRW
ncbi:unnamed protein product [Echinostoma caproni]|uniref:Uncharacterized protein n=1 Tax=Echinostoma caproni TaxID=27848 RepID=A0A183AZE5_9TREM|nr:unnamed protein product [Echinostoma caproni]